MQLLILWSFPQQFPLWNELDVLLRLSGEAACMLAIDSLIDL